MVRGLRELLPLMAGIAIDAEKGERLAIHLRMR
jgi:hypothetical protein